MSEDLGKEMAIEAAKAVAVEGYKDTLQPMLKAVGSVIALPFQAIDAALSKPKLWVAEKHYNYERTRQLLAEKLQYTPEELIVPPENYVAVPALQQIAYCFDSDELRDMYANLLANSMNKVVKNGVHPGFVEIIKQLSPDEAKILRYINNVSFVPTVALKAYKKNGETVVALKLFTNIGELCDCEDCGGYEKHIDNLIRLGLINASTKQCLADKSRYDSLKNHSYILSRKAYIENMDKIAKVDFVEGYMELTVFGKAFCSICLQTQNSIIELPERDNCHDQL
ncbi:MAG: DUF4393 domain-containing protein [Ruminococcaceae bacterium]|nr:DUF4393 domain-containing protein [Oscillospiraceae bacterium]